VPDVTPTGASAVALARLQSMIAASSWFQTWTGAGDATEALEFVLIAPLREPDAPTKPFCVVQTADEAAGYGSVGTNTRALAGAIDIYVLADVPETYRRDGPNASVSRENGFSEFGQMLDAQSGLDVDGVRMFLERIDVLERAEFIAPQRRADNTDYYESWEGVYRVHWGPGAA